MARVGTADRSRGEPRDVRPAGPGDGLRDVDPRHRAGRGRRPPARARGLRTPGTSGVARVGDRNDLLVRRNRALGRAVQRARTAAVSHARGRPVAPVVPVHGTRYRTLDPQSRRRVRAGSVDRRRRVDAAGVGCRASAHTGARRPPAGHLRNARGHQLSGPRHARARVDPRRAWAAGMAASTASGSCSASAAWSCRSPMLRSRSSRPAGSRPRIDSGSRGRWAPCWSRTQHGSRSPRRRRRKSPSAGGRSRSRSPRRWSPRRCRPEASYSTPGTRRRTVQSCSWSS